MQSCQGSERPALRKVASFEIASHPANLKGNARLHPDICRELFPAASFISADDGGGSDDAAVFIFVVSGCHLNYLSVPL